MSATHTQRGYCGDPACDGCRLVRGLNESGRTTQTVRNERSKLVEAEPYRSVLLAVAAETRTDPRAIGSALGLRQGLIGSIVQRRYIYISPSTAEAIRSLLPLLPSEQESA